ncbi:MAG: hypothetical protein ACRDT6_28590, partial [Micromonosporaceae bacterium]
ARRFAAAVEAYDELGVVSDAVLCAAWTARAWVAAGEDAAAEPYRQRVRDFGHRGHAAALVALVS